MNHYKLLSVILTVAAIVLLLYNTTLPSIPLFVPIFVLLFLALYCQIKGKVGIFRDD